MQFQNLIWDFDGTLFDTYPSMTRALQAALKWMGFDAPYDEVYQYFKRSRGEAMAHFAAIYEISATELSARYDACAKLININSVLPMPYVAGLLARVRSAGGQHFIFTHRGDSVLRHLDHCHLTPYFTEVVSSGTRFARKPSPEGNLYLMETHGLDPAHTLAIGDRELDVRAAKEAGFSACLLTPEPVITEADFQISDFSRFDKLIGLPG